MSGTNNSGRGASLVAFWEGRMSSNDGSDTEQEEGQEDELVYNLSPNQLQALARKVYALMLDELRIEAERHGRTFTR